MIPLRKAITDYSRSCEHLISAAAEKEAIPFTQDEIDWITYYTTEMTTLVDQLVQKFKPQIHHDRETMQAFAVASEALFLTERLTGGEKDSIRDSISDVTTQILNEHEGGGNSGS
ncbi:MAG: hypothetical protein QM706_04075 [Nitrospira sp.]